MPLQFTHLVLSGGGAAALTYFGSLRFLEVEGLDSYIRNVAGTSMGAIFAAAYALKIPLSTLESRLMAWMEDEEKCSIPFSDLLHFTRNLGLDDGRRFMDLLRPEIDRVTFLDLSKKTGMNLVVCATHLGTMEAAYFSVDNTPHVLVSDAVRASIAVPWLFQPVKIGDDYYVDGGITDNLPFYPFQNVPSTSVLIMHTYPKINLLAKDLPPHEQPFTYTVSVLSRFFTTMGGVSIIETKYPYYIKLTDSPMPFMSMSMQMTKIHLQLKKDELDACITYGYETAYNTLRKHLIDPSQTS